MSARRRRRLSVIIPFRDRYDHLSTLLPMLEEHLRDIPHRITVVEQGDDRPFNKGKLLNAGAVLSPACDYFCFHDVDMVPAWRPEARRAYGYTRSIVHLAGRCEQRGFGKPAPNCLSGVVLFDRATFFAVNGFSNQYWGWGHEDNDLYARAVFSGKRITFRPYFYWSLPHDAAYRCNHPDWEANCERYEQMARGDCDYLREGLSSLSYTLVSREAHAACDWITILT